jgi:hypothetical protein
MDDTRPAARRRLLGEPDRLDAIAAYGITLAAASRAYEATMALIAIYPAGWPVPGADIWPVPRGLPGSRRGQQPARRVVRALIGPLGLP